MVEDATSEKREAPAGEDGGGKLEGEAEGERGVVMAQG